MVDVFTGIVFVVSVKMNKKEEYNLVKCMVLTIYKFLKKEHPKLIRVDSNLFHFIVYEVAKKMKLPIARGWFKHGPYIQILDDVLIDLGWMDKSQHQLHGDEKIMEKIIECGCHK